MDIKIIRDTVVSGKDCFAGDVLKKVDDKVAKELIRLEKAQELKKQVKVNIKSKS